MVEVWRKEIDAAYQEYTANHTYGDLPPSGTPGEFDSFENEAHDGRTEHHTGAEAQKDVV